MLISEKVSSSDDIFLPATSVAKLTMPLKCPAASKFSLFGRPPTFSAPSKG